MPKIVADLHLHSSFSDGLNSPEAIYQTVSDKEIKRFSLTDHDSVKGNDICQKLAPDSFIPGIELTATHEDMEVHVLGYFIDSSNGELLETLEKISEKRKKRLFNIIEKLNSQSNLNIDIKEVESEIGEGSFNRLNLARFMINNSISPNLERCFERYLGDYSDSYETVNFFSPVEAIALIHRAGGRAFLAHPCLGKTSTLIPELAEKGLDGLEAFHPSHTVSNQSYCLDMAAEYGLGVSGGSDYHGNENSVRQILAAGLNNERLASFLGLNPNDKKMIASG